MRSPLIIGVFAFVAILAGAFAGWVLRQRLPQHHLTDDTKNLVSVSMAVVATISTLVLGLLISNANSAFIAVGGEVTSLSAQILRLDQILRRYGPETGPAREKLRRYAESKAADLFPEHSADVRLGNPATYELLQDLEDSLLALRPENSRDQWWLGQATTLAAKIGDLRWLLAQQVGQGTPEDIRCTSRVLVDVTVHQFWSIRSTEPSLIGHAHSLRARRSCCRGNGSRTGTWVRRTRPHLGATDAAGSENLASSTDREFDR